MELKNPAIVVSAWNRPASLERLLKSISESDFSGYEVNLIISLDGGGGEETIRVAADFQWRFGKKEIRISEKHLGLKEHILRCGDYSAEFGSIILLEDDLLVSPEFYSYSVSALSFYESQKEIAGISLYKYEIAESGFLPFQSIDDGFDNWFMRHPSSWGFCIRSGTWKAFREFLIQNPRLPDSEKIPLHIRNFSAQSWKKHFAHFLIGKQLLMVFPRNSLSTNFEDPGTHASTKNLFQVPLLSGKKAFHFSQPEETLAVYGADFEILPSKLKQAVPLLAAYDFECDFLAQKDKYSAPFVLTTRTGKNPVISWGLNMQPDIANLIQGISGNDVALFRKEDVGQEPVKEEILFYRYGALRKHMYETAINAWKEKFPENSAPAIFYETRERIKRELEKYPDFSVVIPFFPGMKTAVTETMNSLVQLNYPFLKILIVHDNGEDLGGVPEHDSVQMSMQFPGSSLLKTGINKVSGDLVIVAWPGTIFPKGCLQEAGKIFRKFPHLQWINGIASSSGKTAVSPGDLPAANSRFDLFWFQRCFSTLKKPFFPGVFVARKNLWDEFEGLDSMEGDHLIFVSFVLQNLKRYILFPALLGMQYGSKGAFSSEEMNSASVEIAKISVRHISLSVLIRSFFQSDIPFLRSLYPVVKELPEMLRFDSRNDTWYFSRY